MQQLTAVNQIPPLVQSHVEALLGSNEKSAILTSLLTKICTQVFAACQKHTQCPSICLTEDRSLILQYNIIHTPDLAKSVEEEMAQDQEEYCKTLVGCIAVASKQLFISRPVEDIEDDIQETGDRIFRFHLPYFLPQSNPPTKIPSQKSVAFAPLPNLILNEFRKITIPETVQKMRAFIIHCIANYVKPSEHLDLLADALAQISLTIKTVSKSPIFFLFTPHDDTHMAFTVSYETSREKLDETHNEIIEQLALCPIDYVNIFKNRANLDEFFQIDNAKINRHGKTYPSRKSQLVSFVCYLTPI